MKPLLSLCIPTFNRGEYLRNSLEAIVRDPIFLNTNDVEVVVSDNCSSDCTEEIAHDFVRRFPGKIRYFRNERNLMTANFALALSRATGVFRKFQVDTWILLPGALQAHLEFVRKWQCERPVLFWMNDSIPRHNVERVLDTMDQLLDYVTFFSTWTGGFGLWEGEIEAVQQVFDNHNWTLLPMTAALFELFKRRGKAVVYDPLIYYPDNQGIAGKRGYNKAELFGINYLSILREYIGAGGLSKSAYAREKKRMFWGALFPGYFDFHYQQNFTKGGYWKYTAEFHRELYYWKSFLVVARWYAKRPVMYVKLFWYGRVIKNEKKYQKYQERLGLFERKVDGVIWK